MYSVQYLLRLLSSDRKEKLIFHRCSLLVAPIKNHSLVLLRELVPDARGPENWLEGWWGLVAKTISRLFSLTDGAFLCAPITTWEPEEKTVFKLGENLHKYDL